MKTSLKAFRGGEGRLRLEYFCIISMRVYLDNNVLIDIEKNEYNLMDFLSITGVEYYYSNAHISELLNGIDKSIPGLKEKRLSTINALCGNNYLFQDAPSRIMLAICTPEQAYENVSRLGSMRERINELANNFTPNRAGILKEFQWDSKEVGNYSPKEIFEVVDIKFRESKYHFGIKEYLRRSEAYTGSTIYSSLFNLLDMVSYRKDKDNVARLYDSSHAYYAQKCAILVSNDARMRVKAEAVYNYLNVWTRVMSAEEYVTSFR